MFRPCESPFARENHDIQRLSKFLFTICSYLVRCTEFKTHGKVEGTGKCLLMDLEQFLATRVRGSTQQRHFFHFSDRKNLPSIKKHGLLSTSELRRLGLFKDVTPGGDTNSQESDHKTGTDQYVCLCFTDNHPMSYVASSTRTLFVNAVVASTSASRSAFQLVMLILPNIQPIGLGSTPP